jgi:hypothetical protein
LGETSLTQSKLGFGRLLVILIVVRILLIGVIVSVIAIHELES